MSEVKQDFDRAKKFSDDICAETDEKKIIAMINDEVINDEEIKNSSVFFLEEA